MRQTSARLADEIEAVVQAYGNMLFRICLVMLGNESDAEDAVQDTFLKLLQKAPAFASAEHQKAWLIKVATNRCRDVRRFRSRRPQINLTDLQMLVSDPESCGIIEALMALPERFRIVLTLYYVEEYSMEKIASVIGKTTSAVKMRLQKGRRLLEEEYRKEE
ncbi:MAG: RNA polymerase sigma factor [Oscillospiraceae bacterium]|nr:RNA polymerase sigma factor [Oscillospiraceae bacterium]